VHKPGKRISWKKSSTSSIKSLPNVLVKPQRKMFSSSSLLPIKSRRPPVSRIPAQPHVSNTFVKRIFIPYIPVHKREGDYIGDITMKGIRHGRGDMVYTCPKFKGDTYSGSWKFDKFHGPGKYVGSSGGMYEGKWISGAMHGRGTYTFPDGSVYSGEFQNDDFNGIGTLTDVDGSVYSGGFKDDLFHGRGKLINKDGSISDGIFEKYYFIKGI
jgi:hypothetical protein